MRLTMKAIIRWEQLNKKPFSLLNYSSENEIISLFYVCTNTDIIQISLDEFKKTLTEDSVKEMIKEFERQTSLTSQFQAVSKKSNNKSEDQQHVYIKDIVPTLVMNGLDVYFAMNDMELCDLPIFLNAYDQKVKDALTAQRLWTYIQLSPHLTEKIKSPKDLYAFSWEMKEDTISEAELEEGKNEFLAFLQTEKTN